MEDHSVKNEVSPPNDSKWFYLTIILFLVIVFLQVSREMEASKKSKLKKLKKLMKIEEQRK